MFSILSLNIKAFEWINDDKKNPPKLLKMIRDTEPDFICLQEDLQTTPSNYFPNYTKGNFKNIDASYLNSIYYRKGLEFISDIKIEQVAFPTDISEKDKQEGPKDLQEGHQKTRSFTVIHFGKIKIVNTHLTGGRFEDPNYKSLLDIKDKQIQYIIDYCKPTIIVGDFNGDYKNITKQMVGHPVFKKISKADKELFKIFWSGGHAICKGYEYERVNLNYVTSMYDTRPDHIYYLPKLYYSGEEGPWVLQEEKKENTNFLELKPIEYNQIDMITRHLSDHDGIFVKFKIIEYEEYVFGKYKHMMKN